MTRLTVVGAALASALVGCQFLPLAPVVECGTVPRQACEALAADLIAQARVDYPDLRVTRVTLTTPTGGYSVEFSDGSMYAVTP